MPRNTQAIISGLLLAGNNPNTLEAIIGQPPAEEPSCCGWRKGFAYSYDSRYRPAWIWDRAKSKKMWLDKVAKTWEADRQTPVASRPDDFRETIFQANNYKWVALTAYSLIVIPSVFAFLTSYFTPIVGLSCRSMTFLAYMLSQFFLIGLWIYDIEFTTFDSEGRPLAPFMNGSMRSGRPIWPAVIWWSLASIFGAAAIFFSIG